jgi:hypothetical protein
MAVALARIVKRVPSVAVGGLITAVTVLTWGKLYQAVPMAVGESGSTTTPETPSAPGEGRDLSSLLDPAPSQQRSSDDGYEAKEGVPECSSVYPNLKVCSQLPHRYMYGSEREALGDLKNQLGNSSLRIQTPRPTTGGPCPGTGQHYNVRDAKSPRDYPASIVCCPCCDDDDFGAPTADRLCGIVAKDPGCDTRRRAVDASCEE